MKIARVILIIICTSCFALQSFAQRITYQNDVLRCEHDLYGRFIEIGRDETSPVKVQIWDRESEDKLIAQTNDPYFEFVLNNQLFTANDPLWKYQSHSMRAMGNDGTEVLLVIDGGAAIPGLTIEIYQQLFPGTTLVREKMILKSNGREIRINKLDNKLHFKFPQYSLMHPASKTEVTEIRIASWASEQIEEDLAATDDDRRGDLNLTHCHMFHPREVKYSLGSSEAMVTKGPFNVVVTKNEGWIMAYEHASQDYRANANDPKSEARDHANLDAAQGVKGYFESTLDNASTPFIGLHCLKDSTNVTTSIEILKGGYFDNELIKDYETVWSANAFFNGDYDLAMRLIRIYLQANICEYPASRKPDYYYNTWGYQRDVSNQVGDLRAMMTEDTYLEEIEMADQLGVDLFVLDDGWEVAQGDWTPNKKRLPRGLAPIKKELDRRNIKMGIWLSPMGIDTSTDRYKAHPGWVILDDRKEPIKAQWDHPAFDFVSDFKDLFVEDCKKLIDQGADFFKWDAMNSFRSYQPDLHHGGKDRSKQEIIDRYDYLLPFYVTDAMRELVEYKNDLVIEVDVTEERRTTIGLMPLAYGKFFWMNNGASSYGDYSTYRGKSMRTIISQFAGLIPLELFTFANYPHNARPYSASRYNTNTSLIAGHGFWGNLRLMTDAERIKVGEKVALSKRVLPFIAEGNPKVIGKVGSSPEIYTAINVDQGAGQIVAFSGSAIRYDHKATIKNNEVLAILHHAYQMNEDTVSLDFVFNRPEDTKEVFIIPNMDEEISIKSSTCWLKNVTISQGNLEIETGAAGEQVIWIGNNYAEPQIRSAPGISYEIRQVEKFWVINLKEEAPITILIDFK